MPTIQSKKIIQKTLKQLQKSRLESDRIIAEANKILEQDLLSEKKILQHLTHYQNQFELVDENDVDEALIYEPNEIKKTAIKLRLKFLDSNLYKSEIPYEAVLKIREYNTIYKRDIKSFKILALPEAFQKQNNLLEAALFAKTNYGNYYLIHQWGEVLPSSRKWLNWPLQTFETLSLSILVCTLMITLSLPTNLITLDSKAQYFSGYRAAAFFHLLIFNFGVTAYFTFAFAKNFSSSIWNQKSDFD